jgi:hypothetical protein
MPGIPERSALRSRKKGSRDARGCDTVSCVHVLFAHVRLIDMRSLIRTIMVWVLFASLPVQGIAAAIKLPCTMAHDAALADARAESMDDCDEAGMAMPAAEPTAQAHGDASLATPDIPCDKASHQHSCRTCPACQVAAVAPPPFAMPVLAVAHVAYDYVSPTSAFEGWIPSLIERPPRS